MKICGEDFNFFNVVESDEWLDCCILVLRRFRGCRRIVEVMLDLSLEIKCCVKRMLVGGSFSDRFIKIN